MRYVNEPTKPFILSRLLARLFASYLEQRGWVRQRGATIHYTDPLFYWWYGPYGKEIVEWRYHPEREYSETTDSSTLDAVLTEIAKKKWGAQE